MSSIDDVGILRRELLGLFDRIQTIRHEIASIRKPGDDRDRFATMSDELDAIVEATEGATNTIMESAEAIDEIMMAIRPTVKDPDAAARLNAVPDHIGSIFEACSFQDITGQRITKVVKTLQYIETRVNSLIAIWGEAELSSVEPRDENENLSAGDDRRLLNGPQLKGQGVSQSDVDALLGETLPKQAEAPDIAPTPKTPPPPPPAQEPAPKQKADSPPPSKPVTAKPPPPAKPAKPEEKPDEGVGLAQDDIDKLFG